MGAGPEFRRRQAMRLAGYDYSSPGAYFVTICVKGRRETFGEIADGVIQPSPAGQKAHAVWSELGGRFPHVGTLDFVVMPNHVHGIVLIEAPETGAMNCAPTNRASTSVGAVAQGSKPVGAQFIASARKDPTLGQIVRVYKAVVTRHIRQEIDPSFGWQRNYYEHVIRNDDEMCRIRQYIHDNPTRWELDRNNPALQVPAQSGHLSWDQT